MKTTMTKLLQTAALAVAITTGAATTASAEQYALMVAIDDYSKVDGAGDLPGCRNDLKALKASLMKHFGFPEANIAVLTDAKATKSRILRELDAMVAKAAPGDSVVVYYSGHGSQVPDMNDDDETDDGLDEVLITYDFNDRDSSTWLLDDHLRASLSRLKTKRALVLIDACHAGTGTRGPGDLAKIGVINKRAEFGFENMFGRGRVETGSFGISKASPSSHVLIGACAANEVSALGVYDGVKSSLFTTALVNVLPRVLGSSLADLNTALYAEMQRLHADAAETQHPQLEGPSDLSINVLIGAGAAPAALAGQSAAVPVPEPTDGLPSAFRVSVTADKRSYRPEEKMVATVISETAGYLRLYYIDKSGDTALIFPNHYQRDNKIAAGQRVEVGGQAAAFIFRMKAPTGTEMLLAAVSPTQFEDAEALDFSKEKPLMNLG